MALSFTADQHDAINHYWPDSQLWSPDTKKIKMHHMFAAHLLSLQRTFGLEPLPITSCCRSINHNKTVGGIKHSFHIYEYHGGTMAIDVSTHNRSYAFKHTLMRIATHLGWSVGVYKNHFHLDYRQLDHKAKTIFSGRKC